MTASTLTQPGTYTVRDLERLSDQGHHYELVQGELYKVSPSGGPHGPATSRVVFHVTGHIYANALGETFPAETGFIIGRNPDSVLAPDFAYVAYERLPDPLPDGFVPVVPDLVLETRSPGDTKREVAEKVERWLAAGVALVWEINPKTRVLTTHRAGRPPHELGLADTLDGEDVLPGFTLLMADAFPPRPR